MGEAIDFRLLGPIELWKAGIALPLARTRLGSLTNGGSDQCAERVQAWPR
jgi:hypothetical protein